MTNLVVGVFPAGNTPPATTGSKPLSAAVYEKRYPQHLVHQSIHNARLMFPNYTDRFPVARILNGMLQHCSQCTTSHCDFVETIRACVQLESVGFFVAITTMSNVSQKFNLKLQVIGANKNGDLIRITVYPSHRIISFGRRKRYGYKKGELLMALTKNGVI